MIVREVLTEGAMFQTAILVAKRTATGKIKCEQGLTSSPQRNHAQEFPNLA